METCVVQLIECRKHKDLICFHLILQGASIKHLEAGSDGRVVGVKLENGSTIEADTVIQKCLLVYKNKILMKWGYTLKFKIRTRIAGHIFMFPDVSYFDRCFAYSRYKWEDIKSWLL